MAERKPLFVSADGLAEEMSQADTLTLGGMTMGGPVVMSGYKVTGLANGSASSQDAATVAQTEAAIAAAPTKPHNTSHQDGGSDELSVAGLSGLLADAQVASVLRAIGPSDLSVGAVADGQFLRRVGAAVVGSSEAATKTTASMFVYANASTGSDANDGLSASTPKLTIAAALAVLPDILNHQCSLNLVGTFTENVAVTKVVNANFFIDGGYTNVTPQALGGAGVGPFTCDIASSTSIGLSTLAVATDTYEGYWIEIVSGAGAGQRRKIFSHDATTFVPVRNWNTAPVAGSSVFQVVAPSTVLDGSITLGSCGGATIVLQQLFLQKNAVGANSLVAIRNSCAATLQGVMVNSNSTFAAVQGRQCLSFGFTGGYTNPLTFAGGSPSSVFTGVSVISSRRILLSSTTVSGLFAVSSRGGLEIFNSNHASVGVDLGCRIRGKVVMQNVAPVDTTATNALFAATSGYQVSQVDGAAGVGIQMFSVSGAIGPIVVKNCSSHGIEVVNSYVNLLAGLSGSGNGGAGAYVHANSSFYTKAGTAPTITGAVGDLAVDSQVAAISTWAAIEAGTQVTSLNEMSVVRRN